MMDIPNCGHTKRIDIEKAFLERLKDQRGMDYTKRMDQLIEDLETSWKFSKEFSIRRKSSPRYLHFLAFTNANWEGLHPLLMSPPSEVAHAQKAFEKFYRSKKGGRVLRWDLQLSDVKLAVMNVAGVQKVRCSGDYATILLVLNRRPRVSLSALADAVGSNIEVIEEKVQVLVSKKLSKILAKKGSDVWVHTDATAPKKKIRIRPLIQSTSTAPDAEPKSSVVENQDRQIEAVVISILKPVKTMDREVLRNMVSRQIVGLENAVFDARLAKLQAQDFIRIEPCGEKMTRGNTELCESLSNFFMNLNCMNSSNARARVLAKCQLGLSADLEISWIANHFFELDRTELRRLNDDILSRILSQPTLKLNSEDSLLQFILGIGEFDLLGYVDCVYLSLEGIRRGSLVA
jgi:hypothetical protein